MELRSISMAKHQLHVTWSLADDVLADITDQEALWCPSPQSWTVRPTNDDRWQADWSEPEAWPAPPTSLAWVQWHVIWWWSTVLDRTFGAGTLERADVTWPGAAAAHRRIDRLRRRWIEQLDDLSETDLGRGDLTMWPYTDGRPFALVVGWVNIELMKNVAEMCLLRRSTPHYIGGRFR